MSTHHVRPDDLRAWVLGEADGLVSMSVEQHVVVCSACQAAVATSMNTMPYAAGLAPDAPSPAPVDFTDVWAAVRDEIEVPRASWLERLLVRLGLPRADAMLAAAAPALRGSWICALALAVTFALAGVLSMRSGSAALVLMIAPVMPVFGVAIAFGPDAGPALEQESSTPYPLERLILLRAAAVLLAALPVVMFGQLVLRESAAWLWLLPALGFTAAVLGLSTWFGPWRPAVAISLAWVVITFSAARLHTIWGVVAPRYLVLYVVMLVAGSLVFVVRSRRLGTIGRIPS